MYLRHDMPQTFRAAEAPAPPRRRRSRPSAPGCADDSSIAADLGRGDADRVLADCGRSERRACQVHRDPVADHLRLAEQAAQPADIEHDASRRP